MKRKTKLIILIGILMIIIIAMGFLQRDELNQTGTMAKEVNSFSA